MATENSCKNKNVKTRTKTLMRIGNQKDAKQIMKQKTQPNKQIQ